MIFFQGFVWHRCSFSSRQREAKNRVCRGFERRLEKKDRKEREKERDRGGERDRNDRKGEL